MKEQDLQEKKLFGELEALYHQVVESEKSEADNDPKEDLHSYYQVLQVSADASLETIKEIYERLVSFWSPGRFADNPSVREKSEIKLAEITRAYERILALRQRENEWHPPEPTNKNPDPLSLFPSEEEIIPPFHWWKIFLGGGVFVILGMAIFFWPTFYHYETISSGNQAYQTRMNRITGNLTFFDGEKWSLPPIPAAKPLAPQPLPEPVPAASPSASPSPQPEPAAVTRPEAKEEAGVSNKEKAPPEKQAIRPAAAKGYAIQIAAMRNINSAQELAEKQRMSGQPAYMAIIKSKDQEVLHGVFIGRFAKKWEAARYMEEKKMKNFFPGCFIQTLP